MSKYVLTQVSLTRRKKYFLSQINLYVWSVGWSKQGHSDDKKRMKGLVEMHFMDDGWVHGGR